MTHKLIRIASLVAACALTAPVWAQVDVTEPWVRATVPHQKATGAFMNLSTPTDARLVEARSSVANIVEIHEMVMDGDVMKMRAIDGLPLPAGETVELKPGGYHVMLIDLKDQVREGDAVPLTLIVEGEDGQQQTLEITAEARPLNPGKAQDKGHPHHGH